MWANSDGSINHCKLDLDDSIYNPDEENPSAYRICCCGAAAECKALVDDKIASNDVTTTTAPGATTTTATDPQWRRCLEKDIIYVDSFKTHAQAQQACASLFGPYATLWQPGTLAEAEVVAERLTTFVTSQAWVGMREPSGFVGTSSSFNFQTTGQMTPSGDGDYALAPGIPEADLPYFVWGASMPTNDVSQGDCVIANRYVKYRSYPCAETRPFVCERPVAVNAGAAVIVPSLQCSGAGAAPAPAEVGRGASAADSETAKAGGTSASTALIASVAAGTVLLALVALVAVRARRAGGRPALTQVTELHELDTVNVSELMADHGALESRWSTALEPGHAWAEDGL